MAGTENRYGTFLTFFCTSVPYFPQTTHGPFLGQLFEHLSNLKLEPQVISEPTDPAREAPAAVAVPAATHGAGPEAAPAAAPASV